MHGAADAFGLVGGGEAPGVFEVDVFGQAGVVGEEWRMVTLSLPLCGEVGQVLGDGVVEVELACS